MPVKVSNVFDDGFEWISSDEEFEDDVPPKTAPSPLNIEPIVFTFFISYSILGVIRAEYVVNKIADDHGDVYEGKSDIIGIFQEEICQTNASQTTELHNHVQIQTAYWLLGLNVAEMLPALIVAPIINQWGKTFGLRAALLIPNIGYLISSITWLAAVYNNSALYYLIIGQILQGVLGGFPALMSLCNSFLAENRAKVDRAIRLIILGVVSELGAGLTQVGLGYWISNTTFLPPYWCVFGAMIFNIVYIFFFLGDDAESKEGSTLKSDHKESVFNFLFYSERLRQKRSLLILVLLFVHMMVLYASLNVVIIHAFSPPLCWTSIRSGLFVGFTLFCGSLGTLFGSRFFLLVFEELGVAQIGIWSFIGSLCIVAFGKNSLVVYIATLVGCFRFLISPALRNLLARVVDLDEQIVVFRLASMAETCGMLLGPTLFNLIYASSVAYSSSVTFVSMAVVYVLLSAVILYFQISMRANIKETKTANANSASIEVTNTLIQQNGAVARNK